MRAWLAVERVTPTPNRDAICVLIRNPADRFIRIKILWAICRRGSLPHIGITFDARIILTNTPLGLKEVMLRKALDVILNRVRSRKIKVQGGEHTIDCSPRFGKIIRTPLPIAIIRTVFRAHVIVDVFYMGERIKSDLPP